jgi:outer membrane receptor protein involved in Fe transport
MQIVQFRFTSFARRAVRGLMATVLASIASLSFAGDVTGRAADITGAGLPGARITVQNLVTGAETVAASDERGSFRIVHLAAGTYRVTVAFEGLSSESRTVTLEDAGEHPSLEFLLKPSDLLEDVTVTATRAERDAMLVPLRTDTLAREELQVLSPTSTGDALIKAPGITPVGGGPFGIRPRLRGLDSTRLLVLVDGERLNNARTATDRSGTEVSLVNLDSVESLEVVGGSGSVLYGTDALAGTVNIITTQPKFSDTLRFTYGFDGFYTSNEDGRRGTVTLGASTRRLSLQVSGSMEDFGNYRAGASGAGESSQRFFDEGRIVQEDTIDDNFGFAFNAFPDPFNGPFTRSSATIPFSSGTGNSINATGLYALSERQTIQVKYIRRRMEDVGFPDFQAPMFFAETSLPYNNLDRVSARYEGRSLTPWLTSLRVSTYWQDQRRLLRTRFPVQFPAPASTFFPISVFRLNLQTDTEQHVQTPGLDVQGTIAAGRGHLLTVGTMVYQDRSSDARTNTSQQSLIGNVTMGQRGPQANVFAVPQVMGTPSVTHPIRVPDATFADLGLFAQDEWEINRLMRLVAGVRVDRYRVSTAATPGYDIDSLVNGARPPIDPASLPNEEGDRIARTAVTGDVGLVVRPSETLSVLARYGRSYRHANLEELLFSGPATVGAIVPNVQVEPETGHNVDVGLKFRHARGSASLSYFNNTYDGFISTEIVAAGSSGPLSQAINFTDVRIQGIEGDFDLPLVLRPGIFTLFGTFAWTRGDVLRGTNPLTGESLAGTPADNISPLKSIAGVRFSDARDRFWAEYGARVQAEVSRVAPTLLDSPYLIAQDLLSLDGFVIHRAAGGVNFGRAGSNRTGIVVAVENLGDTFYREQFQFAPARGRTFTIGLHVRGM